MAATRQSLYGKRVQLLIAFLCLAVCSKLPLATAQPVSSIPIELISPNEESGGRFGYISAGLGTQRISGLGDVNGDGRGDFVVTASAESPDTSPEDAGRAYIFSGADFSLLHTLISPNEIMAGSFGFAASGIPDVDGDGREDVVIGANDEGPGSIALGAGRAHIYSGSTGSFLYTLISPNQVSGGRFASSVSGIPDVDGDGRGDLVVGAYSEDLDEEIIQSGRAYIYSGADGLLLHTLVSPNPLIAGAFGGSVAGIPDVNGDGRGDVVVGAFGEGPGSTRNIAGKAYVFSGSTGSLLHTLLSPNEEVAGRFASSISSIPDVNGDGPWDLVVGAHKEDPGTSPMDAGRAYLYSGADGSLIHTLVSPNEEIEGYFGRAVSGIPDLNGDGRGDVIIGAEGEDPGTSQADAGRAYIFSGSDGLLLQTLVSPNEESGGGFGGVSVAGTPDLNGDVLGDVVVGAREDPGSSPDGAGRAYVFLTLPLPSAVGNWSLFK